MGYHAVVTDAEDAKSALLGLWQRNLNVRADVAEKFRWFYLDGPLGHASAFLLRTEDGSVVGSAGVGRRRFVLHERSVSAGLIADLCVDKEHRSALPAILLQRSVRRHALESFDLAYGFPNKSAVAVHRRIGFHVLGRIGTFARVLRHRRYVARIIRSPALASLGGIIIEAAMAAREWPRRIQVGRTHRLEMLDAADQRFDALHERARGAYPLHGERTAAFLNWRYLAKPAEKHRIAALLSLADGQIAAYAVVRYAGEISADLQDLYGTGDEDVSRLLTLLLPSLRRSGFSVASFAYLGHPRVAALLRSHGFIPRGEGQTVIVDVGSGSGLDPAWIRDPANWYLVDGDEDT